MVRIFVFKAYNLNNLLTKNDHKVPPEKTQSVTGFSEKFASYAPHFKGLTPVNEAVQTVRSTWEGINIDSGYGGAFISQFGNKQWL
jgi:hypothetical protein